MKSAIMTGILCVVATLVLESAGADSEDWPKVQTQLVPLTMDPEQTSAEAIAIRWEKRALSEAARPPVRLRHVFLRRRAEEDMDRLRIRYLVNDRVVTITHTLFLAAVEVEEASCSEPPLPLSADRAKALGKLLFAVEDDAECKVIEEPPERLKGVLGGRVRCGWRQDARHTWFFVLKDEGAEKSSFLPSSGLRQNRYWFSGDER